MRIAVISNSCWNIFNFRLALIKKLAALGHEVIAVAPADNYVFEIVKTDGVQFFPLQNLDRKSTSLRSNLRLLYEILGILRRTKPDLALNFTIKPNIFGSFAAHFAGVPSISSLEGRGHAGGQGFFFQQLVHFLYKKAFKAARFVVFLNESDKNAFVEKSLVAPQKAVFIHGPGVDTEHFYQTEQPKNGELTVLFCGRLLKEKGVHEFVDAANLCRKEGLPIRFQLLGSPDPDNPSSIDFRQIEQWIHEKTVDCLGHRDDVRPFIEKANVVVLPSVYHEGVPRSLLEAMSMQKVIITTDAPGCRDTVKAGKNGFLVPQKNAEKLAEAIKICASMPPDQLFEMGRNGRKFVLEEFDDRIILEKWVELIQRAASK